MTFGRPPGLPDLSRHESFTAPAAEATLFPVVLNVDHSVSAGHVIVPTSPVEAHHARGMAPLCPAVGEVATGTLLRPAHEEADVGRQGKNKGNAFMVPMEHRRNPRLSWVSERQQDERAGVRILLPQPCT